MYRQDHAMTGVAREILRFAFCAVFGGYDAISISFFPFHFPSLSFLFLYEVKWKGKTKFCAVLGYDAI